MYGGGGGGGPYGPPSWPPLGPPGSLAYGPGPGYSAFGQPRPQLRATYFPHPHPWLSQGAEGAGELARLDEGSLRWGAREGRIAI
jgi:hypothetical protein